MPNHRQGSRSALSVAAGCAAMGALPDQAPSHREALPITLSSKVDGADVCMFRSDASDRADDVTMIANDQPRQDAYNGPDNFKLDPNALNEIHPDNHGDAKKDLSFPVKF